VAGVFPEDVRTVATVLHDFYAWLTATCEIPQTRGHYIRCYFQTLLELEGQSLRTLSRRCGEPSGRRLSKTGS
jgi:hypothetical protein